ARRSTVGAPGPAAATGAAPFPPILRSPRPPAPRTARSERVRRTSTTPTRSPSGPRISHRTTLVPGTSSRRSHAEPSVPTCTSVTGGSHGDRKKGFPVDPDAVERACGFFLLPRRILDPLLAQRNRVVVVRSRAHRVSLHGDPVDRERRRRARTRDGPVDDDRVRAGRVNGQCRTGRGRR